MVICFQIQNDMPSLYLVQDLEWVGVDSDGPAPSIPDRSSFNIFN